MPWLPHDAEYRAARADIVVPKPFGRLATILGAQEDATPLYQKNQVVHGVFLTRERSRLEEPAAPIMRGQVRPLLDDVLPLEKVGAFAERT